MTCRVRTEYGTSIEYRSRRVEVYDEWLTDRSREASELSKFRLVRMLPSEQKLRDYEFTHLDVQSIGTFLSSKSIP